MSEIKSAIYPSLAGKRVLVTGGGSGIGAGVVEAFVAQNATVAFIDIAAADSQVLVSKLAVAGRTAPRFYPCDLCKLPELDATLDSVLKELGGIDILINNAANDDRHEFATVTPEYWDERIAVNLRHLFFAAQKAAASMQRSGGGVIVNLSSISWHLGLKDLVVYQTAKAGIEGMTRAMARELGSDNIRVNAIIPGNVQTPRQMKWYNPEQEAELVALQCLNGRIQPSDVAALALFLASDDARMCTGHSYWIDAGWR
jgi:NAD(P)-dependent dehydrogenase (short-subunit alcohol dehydrogenase family)